MNRVYVDDDGHLVIEREGREEKDAEGADDPMKSLSKSFEPFPALVSQSEKGGRSSYGSYLHRRAPCLAYIKSTARKEHLLRYVSGGNSGDMR